MSPARSMSEPGRNRLLENLPQQDWARIRPELHPVNLQIRTVIHEAGQPIGHVLFMSNGVVSLVSQLRNGTIGEIATIGNEGFVGIPLFLGSESSPARSIVQVSGAGFQMTAGAFMSEVNRRERLYHLVRRYTQAYINQVSQSVICNSFHNVEQRMCRWLLMTHDRVG